jgi:hypothetical protein
VYPWPNILLDLVGKLILRNFHIVARLEIHPKRGAIVEIARAPQRRARGNSATSLTMSAIRVTGTRRSIAIHHWLSIRMLNYTFR